MCCCQAAGLTVVLDNCRENIQGACFTTTDAVSVALLEMCDGLYDGIAAKINTCNEDETLSCDCWAEVVSLRATFQQKCMNSKQEGSYCLFYVHIGPLKPPIHRIRVASVIEISVSLFVCSIGLLPGRSTRDKSGLCN